MEKTIDWKKPSVLACIKFFLFFFFSFWGGACIELLALSVQVVFMSLIIPRIESSTLKCEDWLHRSDFRWLFSASRRISATSWRTSWLAPTSLAALRRVKSVSSVTRRFHASRGPTGAFHRCFVSIYCLYRSTYRYHSVIFLEFRRRSSESKAFWGGELGCTMRVSFPSSKKSLRCSSAGE